MLLPSYHDVTTLHSFAENFFKRKLPIERSFFFFSKNCLLLLSTQVFQVFDSSTCFRRHLEQTGQEGLDFPRFRKVGWGSVRSIGRKREYGSTNGNATTRTEVKKSERGEVFCRSRPRVVKLRRLDTEKAAIDCGSRYICRFPKPRIFIHSSPFFLLKYVPSKLRLNDIYIHSHLDAYLFSKIHNSISALSLDPFYYYLS